MLQSRRVTSSWTRPLNPNTLCLFSRRNFCARDVSGEGACAWRWSASLSRSACMRATAASAVCQQRCGHFTATPSLHQSWARNSMRPWMCPKESCRAINPATRQECEGCGTEKPKLLGWKCVGCGARNHRGVKRCKGCSEPFEASKDFWMCAVCGENNRIDELDDNSRCGYCSYDMAPLALSEERLAELNQQREEAFQSQQERFDSISAAEAEAQYGEVDGGPVELPGELRGKSPALGQHAGGAATKPSPKVPTSIPAIKPFVNKQAETRHSRLYRRSSPPPSGDVIPPGPPGFDWMCRDPSCAQINPGDEENCSQCGKHIAPAEWECPSCAAVNHLSRSRCFNCHSGIPISWTCPSCNCATSVYDKECRQCHEARPAAEPREVRDVWASENQAGRGGGGGPSFRKSDWYCTSCNGLNFSRRTDCYQCGAPKAAGGSPNQAAGFGDRGGSSFHNAEAQWSGEASQPRASDHNNWVCTHCQASNFRTRSKCWQCGQEAAHTVRGGAGVGRDENMPRFEKEGFQDGPDSKPAEGRMNMWQKTDDWVCAKCFSKNYRGKSDCFKCGASRSLAVSPRRANVRKPVKL